MKLANQHGTPIKICLQEISDLEQLIGSLPAAWVAGVKTIAIFFSAQPNLLTSYHRKKKTFGIHIPRDFSGSGENMVKVIACTLQAIQEFGHIPNRLPASKLRDYYSNWNKWEDSARG